MQKDPETISLTQCISIIFFLSRKKGLILRLLFSNLQNFQFFITPFLGLKLGGGR